MGVGYCAYLLLFFAEASSGHFRELGWHEECHERADGPSDAR